MKWPRFSIKSNKDNCSYGIKSTIAQVVALTTTYLFTMKVGIDMMTPTIIIGAVTDKRNTGYNSLSHITEEQTSWIGSLIYLFPPTGSVAVSFVQNRFGHKVCMWISNVTHFLSIISLYFADSPVELYVSSALMGFNVGFVTGFTISYSSEVCEPKLRGRLSSVTNLFYFAGYLYVTTLYAATADWKISVLFTLIIPLVNSAILYRTPNSPMWLLSKGRTDEAKQTFKNLRGGASEENSNAEFQDMVRYASEINIHNQKTENTQKISFLKDSLYSYMEPETLRPLQLIMFLLVFVNVLSGVPYIPYLLSVFETFEATLHPAWTTTMYTAFGVLGNVLTVISINRLGKRFLSLCTMTTCTICYLSIGIIGNVWPSSPVTSWIKIVLFFMSTFFSSMGITPIVWILMGELFPMKSRNIGAAISSATYFILCFLMTKFYLHFEAITGFYNTFISFGIVGIFGIAYLYFLLPETENKTLKEISEHFKINNIKTETQTI